MDTPPPTHTHAHSVSYLSIVSSFQARTLRCKSALERTCARLQAHAGARKHEGARKRESGMDRCSPVHASARERTREHTPARMRAHATRRIQTRTRTRTHSTYTPTQTLALPSLDTHACVHTHWRNGLLT